MVAFPKPTKKKKKRLNLLTKEKSWRELVKELDAVVSIKVRERDGWKCKKCGKEYERFSKGLTCSHFWKRELKGTRWDFDNLDSLCWMPCHVGVEKNKQGWYMDYMKEKLGENGYEILKMKALTTTNFSSQDLKLLIQIYQS